MLDQPRDHEVVVGVFELIGVEQGPAALASSCPYLLPLCTVVQTPRGGSRTHPCRNKPSTGAAIGAKGTFIAILMGFRAVPTESPLCT